MTLRLLTDETGAMIAAPNSTPTGVGAVVTAIAGDARRLYGLCLDVAGCHEMMTAFIAGRLGCKNRKAGIRVLGQKSKLSWGFVQIDETGSILWGLWHTFS